MAPTWVARCGFATFATSALELQGLRHHVEEFVMVFVRTTLRRTDSFQNCHDFNLRLVFEIPRQYLVTSLRNYSASFIYSSVFD